MTKTTKTLFAICLLISLLITLAIPVIAWISEHRAFFKEELHAHSMAQYFYSGDGTENDPYIIKAPRHLYNLIWLQNKSYFSGSKYFKLDPGAGEDTEIKVLDMKGTFADTDGNTGAVPPIGSESNPFIGYFDGNGCTIKNLWVSSDPNDWQTTPEQYDTTVDYSRGVGFFGYVARPENDTTTPVYVGNFALENIEVTNHLANATVGLAIGYVDAAASKIGVNNGIVTLKNTSTNVASDHTIIGKTASTMIWIDQPGKSGGGDLMVTPGDNTGNRMTNILPISSGRAQLPDSIEGAAYIYSSASRAGIEGGTKIVQYYQTPVSFNDSGFSNGIKQIGSTNNINGFSTTAGNQLDSKSIERFNTYYDNHNKNNAYTLDFSAKVTLSGSTIANCVWFKPEGAGKCALAFLHRSNNAADYMAVYRFLRDSNGNIDTSSIKEIRFCLAKDLKNYTTAYFQCDISQAEIDAGYEYAIGWASNQGAGTTPGFFYMLLAGADTSGISAEGGKAKVLEKVEFVTQAEISNGLSTYFDAQDYAPDKTDIAFTGSPNSTVSLHFNEQSNDGNVHYSSGSQITPVELVAAGYESTLDNNATYPERQKQ